MAEKHSKEGVFSRADVIRIRREIATTPTETFAKEFEVSLQCIRDLAMGRTHQDVNDEAPPVAEVSGKHLSAKNRRARVLELLAAGVRKVDVARELNVSQGYITLVEKGER
jgi:DNA-binding NarL/FixJ family response regulator